jgi:hypothetical protein
MRMPPLSVYWGTSLPKNKAFEFQLLIGHRVAEWFKFSLETRSAQDHAGIYFTIEFLRFFYFHTWFYDIRHWNIWKNRFYKEGEELHYDYQLEAKQITLS